MSDSSYACCISNALGPWHSDADQVALGEVRFTIRHVGLADTVLAGLVSGYASGVSKDALACGPSHTDPGSSQDRAQLTTGQQHVERTRDRLDVYIDTRLFIFRPSIRIRSAAWNSGRIGRRRYAVRPAELARETGYGHRPGGNSNRVTGSRDIRGSDHLLLEIASNACAGTGAANASSIQLTSPFCFFSEDAPCRRSRNHGYRSTNAAAQKQVAARRLGESAAHSGEMLLRNSSGHLRMSQLLLLFDRCFFPTP